MKQLLKKAAENNHYAEITKNNLRTVPSNVAK